MAEYLDVLRDYWTARSDLERAVGGRLPTAAYNGVGNPAAPTVNNATSAPTSMPMNMPMNMPMSMPPSNGSNPHQNHQP